MHITWSWHSVCLALAIFFFILAALRVQFKLEFCALGLAFFASAFLFVSFT